MNAAALCAVECAIAALTYDEVEFLTLNGDVLQSGDAVPLLQRSIAQDLVRIETAISARGQTLLSADAAAIDEALVALAEARRALIGETR